MRLWVLLKVVSSLVVAIIIGKSKTNKQTYLSAVFDHPHILQMFSGRVFEPVFVAFSIGDAGFSDFRFEGQIDQLENLVAVSSCSSTHIYSRDRVTKRHFLRKSWPPRIRGQKLRPGGPEYIKRILGLAIQVQLQSFLS